MSLAPPTSTPARRPERAGFTLIELMVSLAIVVLLVLGVNKIFGIASQTVGAGNAISAAQRNNLTGHTVFHEDLSQAVTFNAPFFIIRSESTAAFRNAADEQADRDYDRSQTSLPDVDEAIRTADWNGDGTEDRVNETTPRTTMDARMHRVDQLCFFAWGRFPRQTGSDDEFVSDMTSSEALIWYGHLTHARGPDLSASDGSQLPRNPGIRPVNLSDPPETAASNPNNFYAGSWNLGRVALLLREPDDANNDEFTRPQNATESPNFIGFTGNDTRALAPLEYGSIARYASRMPPPAAGNTRFPVQMSRFDLAGTSIDGYRRILRTVFDNNNANDWYLRLCYRFDNYQFPLRPLTSAAAARTTPAFLPNCSQFAVEFAGDFVTQDRDTGVVATPAVDSDGFAIPAPDGIIDYIVLDRRNVGGQMVLKTQTRWYGYPRDTGGAPNGGPDGVISGTMQGHLNPDVVPLRDVAGGVAFRFEKDVYNGTIGIPQQNDYAAPGAIPLQGRYLCAWGPEPSSVAVLPPLPKMVRITVGLDDPQGRMAASQMYEYVIELP